jgi:mono/diheme cytochrome c family protein
MVSRSSQKNEVNVCEDRNIYFVIGLLTACGTQGTATPASSPTEGVLPVTQALTDLPLSTVTSAPTDSLSATEPAAATQPAPQGASVSFTNDVLPIIESRCINCHGGDRVEKGLNLKTYADIMAGSENGPVVTAGNAVSSKLIELIVNQKMPKRGPKLTPPQVQLITEWVNQGALNN